MLQRRCNIEKHSDPRSLYSFSQLYFASTHNSLLVLHTSKTALCLKRYLKTTVIPLAAAAARAVHGVTAVSEHTLLVLVLEKEATGQPGSYTRAVCPELTDGTSSAGFCLKNPLGLNMIEQVSTGLSRVWISRQLDSAMSPREKDTHDWVILRTGNVSARVRVVRELAQR